MVGFGVEAVVVMVGLEVWLKLFVCLLQLFGTGDGGVGSIVVVCEVVVVGVVRSWALVAVCVVDVVGGIVHELWVLAPLWGLMLLVR